MTPIVAPDNKYSVMYGQKIIDYSLVYCDRGTMEIAVHPDSTVTVKVPMNADILLIEQKIQKRRGWILKQLNYFKQFNPKTPARCYVNGETHLYLGKQYRLKLTEGSINSVKLSRGFLQITCMGAPNSQLAKELLNDWYMEKATIQFKASMARCLANFSNFDFESPKIIIKKMEKKWGSLSKNGTMTLNTELVKAPKECIDYVVTHELCHLKHHDHSTEFYNLLDSILDDWKKIKHKLELSMI